MTRSIFTIAVCLAVPSLIGAAEPAAAPPVAHDAPGVVQFGRRLGPVDPDAVFDATATEPTAFDPPPAPGAESAAEPPISEAAAGEQPPADEAAPGDESAEPEQTPLSPDAVFSAPSAAQSDFHRVYDCTWRTPYLGPRGRDGSPPGTTNAWVQHPCQQAHGNYYRSADGTWWGNDRLCDVSGAFTDPYDSAFRFGWWGINNDGSLQKIGEYQDLDSSPFWDIDMVRSDGRRTADFWMSGLDEDANSARGTFYMGPAFSAKVRYERFLHRLDHDPLFGKDINDPPLLPADNVVTEDLNVGEDYAIRVQQLDTRFQGRINENLRWRVNVWGQRKFGERQANATAHCFDVNPTPVTNNVCHVLSQRQNIDWQTFEITPVLEANLGPVTVELSHMFRAFGQSDQVVERTYDHFAPFNNPALNPFQYAFVPDTNTNIDRLKLGWILNDENHIYGNAYYGLTENTFRNTSRQYTGFDVRYTNRMLERLTVTTYVNTNADNNESAPFLIVGDPPPVPPPPAGRAMQHPVDHIRTRAGIKGNWEPIEGLEDRFFIASGYEYYQHERDFAVYSSSALGTFRQPDTSSNMFELGPQMRWNRAFNTYVRYKAWFVEEPMVGVREGDGRFNTNQPEQEHRVEVGGSWNPTTNFMTTAQFSVVNRWNTSPFANFSEDNYPFTWTAWYAPTQKLSFSGGYGYYSNWIDQDISLGYRFNLGDQTETTRWNYAGDNHIVNLNANYAWTENVNLVAGAEWSRGNNVFTVPPSPAGADWSQLNTFSDVLIEQTRYTAGVDWQPYEPMTVYFRYVYFDWNDIAADLDSGTTHMALAGAGWIF